MCVLVDRLYLQNVTFQLQLFNLEILYNYLALSLHDPHTSTTSTQVLPHLVTQAVLPYSQ